MFHKSLIERKIEELEESNKVSRDFSKLLDDEEFNQRTRRHYAIMVLKDLIEEIEESEEVK